MTNNLHLGNQEREFLLEIKKIYFLEGTHISHDKVPLDTSPFRLEIPSESNAPNLVSS
jgi:hypothetical protein